MHGFVLVCCLLMMFFTLPALAEVNINIASEQELSEKLKNVGHAKAAAIVEYRETHGYFRSVDDLELVKGIGKSTVEMNRGVLSITSQPAGEDAASASGQ